MAFTTVVIILVDSGMGIEVTIMLGVFIFIVTKIIKIIRIIIIIKTIVMVIVQVARIQNHC